MSSCSRCGGDTDGRNICSACMRQHYQSIIDEERQRELIRSQQNVIRSQELLHEDYLREQERLNLNNTRQIHFNEIKRRLLDLAIEGITDTDNSIKKASIIVRSPEVINNMIEFEELCLSNNLLRNIYIEVKREIKEKDEAEQKRRETEHTERERIRLEEWERDRPRREAYEKEKARKEAEEKARKEAEEKARKEAEEKGKKAMWRELLAIIIITPIILSLTFILISWFEQQDKKLNNPRMPTTEKQMPK